MTHITIYRNHENVFTGFDCDGHAGFAEAGEDIVCAAISMLTINTVNAIESLTQTKIEAGVAAEGGGLTAKMPNGCDTQAELLVNAMILGLKGIQQNYGKKFLKLDFKEV